MFRFFSCLFGQTPKEKDQSEYIKKQGNYIKEQNQVIDNLKGNVRRLDRYKNKETELNKKEDKLNNQERKIKTDSDGLEDQRKKLDEDYPNWFNLEMKSVFADSNKPPKKKKSKVSDDKPEIKKPIKPNKP